ncbi:MAG: DMT family transporter [Oscillospiraceae bacterium]|nr:DMT family transporter [Oscillospiraceae bacterium]
MKFDMTRSKGTMTGALMLASVIWGSGAVMMQVCIDGGIETGLQMFFRFWIGALCLGILIRKRLRQINRRLVMCGILCGSLLFFSFFFLTLGLEYTTPANSAFLSASSVMLVPFISWAMLRIKPERKVFFGCVLCLVGVGILSLKLDSGLHFTLGDSLTLFCAVIFSCYTCTVAKVSSGLDATLFTFVQLLVTAVWSTITLPVSGANFSVIGQDWKALGAVVFLGLFNTGLCYLIQMTAQKSLPPTRVSLILSSESLFGAFFSVLAGYDPFSICLVVGGGIMMLSILLVETNLLRFSKKKAAAV